MSAFRIALTFGFLAAMGFFGVIGFAAVVLDRPPWALAPSTSADVASWVQAVGSVLAILASYLIGARQARDAKEGALTLYRLDRARIAEGCRAIVYQMCNETTAVAACLHGHSPADFKRYWTSFVRSSVQSAVQGFDTMPVHEIGRASAIQYAYEIRQQLASLIAAIDEATDDWHMPRPPDPGQEQAFQRLVELLEAQQFKLSKFVMETKDRIDRLYAEFFAESVP